VAEADVARQGAKERDVRSDHMTSGSLDHGAGLLFPLLDVHVHRQEPQAKREFCEEAEWHKSAQTLSPSVDPADQFPDDRPAGRNRPQKAGAT
jgi:hypothetical protein